MGVLRFHVGAAAVAAVLLLAAPALGASYAKGIDVSNWQGTIDWLQVGDAGYTFAFAKASEGTSYTDVTYAFNKSSVRWLGVRMGAYHYARPSGTGDAAIVAGAIAQADHFVDVAQPQPGDLPPVLDLEQTGGLSPAALVRWTAAWLNEVQARTGLNALIYTSPNFWKTKLGDTSTFAMSGHGLWIAHWTSATAPSLPAIGWGGNGWSFWQWSDCQTVPGIAHCSDADRANAPDPAHFGLPPYPSGAPAPSTPPTVVGTARAGSRLAGVPGTWSGGKPVAFGYQWESCDAAGGGCVPIPGATLPTYIPGAGDVGHALVLAVTATGAGGTASSISPPTVAVGTSGGATAARPAALSSPQVAGTAQVGQTLTASVGTWSGSPTSFAFAWRRCDTAGAGCVDIPGATGSSYVITPGDVAATISVVVTATGAGGSQPATAAPTVQVVPAPVPAAVPGSLAAAAGVAGAVVTSDARATVTWQPGAVPVGTVVSLTPASVAAAVRASAVALDFSPAQTMLPWPVDIAYAAASPSDVAGFSRDGKTWLPIPALTAPVLTGTLLEGTYVTGSVVHVLTREPGRIAFFHAGRWGDPRRISAHAPVLRRLTPLRVVRRRDGTLLVTTRFSTSSQAHLYAAPLTARTTILAHGSRLAGGTSRQALVLRSGGFPIRWRIATHASVVRIRLGATDPWGRRGGFTISFRVP